MGMLSAFLGERMRAWVVPWALVLISCIADLKPDVGALQSDLDAGQGSITGGGNSAGDSNSGNGSNGNNNGTNGNGSNSGNGGSSGDSKDGGVDPEGDAGAPPVCENVCCDNQDSDPAKDVSFDDDIWPILSGCRCHNSNDADQFGILEVGFYIDDYTTLRQGGDNTSTNVIIPGKPCESFIIRKLSEDEPPFGVRMPRDGPPYLSTETIRLISDWIVEGARDN